ncbi:hypothetical protein GB937_005238 [Aspergillus fischeri]|nr:hypothetical protein GB937_005238 [Aspergillus fischeri]
MMISKAMTSEKSTENELIPCDNRHQERHHRDMSDNVVFKNVGVAVADNAGKTYLKKTRSFRTGCCFRINRAERTRHFA